MACARLKILLAAAVHDRGALGLAGLQVFEIGCARAAARNFKMETGEGRLRFAHHLEQIAAQLISRGAAKAMTSPDLAQRMQARIAAGIDCCQLLAQSRIVAQRAFDPGHGLDRQGLIQIGF